MVIDLKTIQGVLSKTQDDLDSQSTSMIGDTAPQSSFVNNSKPLSESDRIRQQAIEGSKRNRSKFYKEDTVLSAPWEQIQTQKTVTPTQNEYQVKYEGQDDFVASVKAKHPKYAQMEDQEAFDAILEEYPVYKDQFTKEDRSALSYGDFQSRVRDLEAKPKDTVSPSDSIAGSLGISTGDENADNLLFEEASRWTIYEPLGEFAGWFEETKQNVQRKIDTVKMARDRYARGEMSLGSAAATGTLGILGGLLNVAEGTVMTGIEAILPQSAEDAILEKWKEIAEDSEVIQSTLDLASNLNKKAINVAKEDPNQGLMILNAIQGIELLTEIVPAKALLNKLPDLSNAKSTISNIVNASANKINPNLKNYLDSSLERISNVVRRGWEIGKDLTKSAISKATWLNPDTITQMLQNNPKFMEALGKWGEALKETEFEDFKGKIDNFITDHTETGKVYNTIRESGQIVDVDPSWIENKIKDLGFKVDNIVDEATGEIIGKKVVATTKSKTRESADINKLQKLLDDWGGRDAIDSEEFLNLRKDLTNMSKFDATTTNDIRTIGRQLRNDLNTEYRPQIAGLEDLDARFREPLDLLNKIKRDFYNKDGSIKDNALSKMANLINRGSEFRLERVEEVIPGFGDRLKMLRAIEDVEIKKGNSVGTYMSSMIGAGGAASLLTGFAPGVIAAIALNPAVFPKLVEIGLKVTGLSKNVGSKILNKVRNGVKLTPSESKVISRAVQSEEVLNDPVIRKALGKTDDLPKKDTKIQKVKEDVKVEDVKPQKVDTSKGKTIEQEQAVKQVREILGDDVEIDLVETIKTPKGEEALGSYMKGAIKIAKNPKTTTGYHEAFHWYLDTHKIDDLRDKAFDQIKKQEGLKTDLQAEEYLAEAFAEWKLLGKTPKGAVKQFLEKIWNEVKKIVGKSDDIQDLMEQIGKKAEKKISTGGKKFQTKDNINEKIGDFKITSTKNLPSNKIYHGTDVDVANKIRKGGFKKWSELPEDAFRGWGYDAVQDSISFSTNPKVARIFAQQGRWGKGTILEAQLKDNARIVNIEWADWAEDINDIIPDLLKKKIDGVYLPGEEEVVIINPKAINLTEKSSTFRSAERWDGMLDVFKEKGKYIFSDLEDEYIEEAMDIINDYDGDIDGARDDFFDTVYTRGDESEIDIDKVWEKAENDSSVKFQKAETNNSLIDEAKKYNSAEEFIDRQEKQFHWTNDVFDMFEEENLWKYEKDKWSKSGFWFSDDKKTAKWYGKNVKEVFIDKSNFNTIDAEWQTYWDFMEDMFDAIDDAKKEWKDWLTIKELSDEKDWSEYNPTTHYIVFDKGKINTKKQLEEIWKEANSK